MAHWTTPTNKGPVTVGKLAMNRSLLSNDETLRQEVDGLRQEVAELRAVQVPVDAPSSAGGLGLEGVPVVAAGAALASTRPTRRQLLGLGWLGRSEFVGV